MIAYPEYTPQRNPKRKYPKAQLNKLFHVEKNLCQIVDALSQTPIVGLVLDEYGIKVDEHELWFTIGKKVGEEAIERVGDPIPKVLYTEYLYYHAVKRGMTTGKRDLFTKLFTSCKRFPDVYACCQLVFGDDINSMGSAEAIQKIMYEVYRKD
jgi:hypothetical protein